MISTRHLAALPGIDDLRRNMQVMAALEAVCAIEVGESCYEYHPKWSRSEQMGAFKNGSGDELFVHFTPAGCFIKGFAHESVMSPYRMKPPTLWPGLMTTVPDDFKSSMTEPAFDIPNTTFALWQLANNGRWCVDAIDFPDVEDADGSECLLSPLDGDPVGFADWLTDNFEIDVDQTIIAHAFRHEPLTDDQLQSLNPESSVRELRAAVRDTGFPLTVTRGRTKR